MRIEACVTLIYKETVDETIKTHTWKVCDDVVSRADDAPESECNDYLKLTRPQAIFVVLILGQRIPRGLYMQAPNTKTNRSRPWLLNQFRYVSRCLF